MKLIIRVMNQVMVIILLKIVSINRIKNRMVIIEERRRPDVVRRKRVMIVVVLKMDWKWNPVSY